ncbi:MAG TPA: hypothetical protein D7I12_04295 [Candidatus Poseidoniales archaeon]|nr:MAG TPA: hypothetical protein D7I12_04295 [Candidatus Poseidoniales archaeon]|tara:strand:+ start:597 stop:998 length:402 start_codon:yes stop_codon:yes gene_type:complete
MSKDRLVRPLSLTMMGSVKEESGSILEPEKVRDLELILPCKEITVRIERRIQRTVIRGGEGDDLLDEGSESAVYDVLSTASVSEYNELMLMFRGGQPNIMDPFDGREVKVAFKSVEYSASNGDLKMQLLEDVD